MNRIPFWIWTIFFITLLPVEQHLGCVFSLAVVNSVAMSTAEQASVEEDVKPLGIMLRSARAGLYGGSTSTFLRTHHTDFSVASHDLE